MKRSPVFAGMYLSLSFLMILLAAPILTIEAADYTVIQGIVERVSGITVTVAGHDYNIATARVLSPSGKDLPRAEIAPGRKVSLFMTRGGITTVVVYPTRMVE
jgi:hypothetical protein